MKKAISPSREENFSEWFQNVIEGADLAENSVVRGCMIIKPNGYALWENIQKELNIRFKKVGVKNAYFPLLIPLSYLEKEAEHVEGFAKECAVVTHRRLVHKDGKLIPEGKLEEAFVIRPTSEMIIGESFSQWVKSYRDLPLKINQWANVMRWEMRPRIFLRTSEFLWQEGHTVHATSAEAMSMAKEMIEIYKEFVQEVLAVPLIVGEKTESEKFPGADITYTIEAIMQDGKALQAGTSHYLGQNFAKAQGIKFLDADSEQKVAFTTSWGVSTRLIGGLIMSHSDDDGLIIPPKVASTHIVILPINKNNEEKVEIEKFIGGLKSQITAHTFNNQEIVVETDWRDLRGGEKYWDQVRKGTPILVEIGKRDIEKGHLVVTRRDIGVGNKQFVNIADFVSNLPNLLNDIQISIFNRSKERISAAVVEVTSKEQLLDFFENKTFPSKLGKAFLNDCEQVRNLLAEHKMSFRCIPLEENHVEGKCIVSGKTVSRKVVIGTSY